MEAACSGVGHDAVDEAACSRGARGIDLLDGVVAMLTKMT